MYLKIVRWYLKIIKNFLRQKLGFVHIYQNIAHLLILLLEWTAYISNPHILCFYRNTAYIEHKI